MVRKTALVLFCATTLGNPPAHGGECDNPDAAWLLCEDFEYGDGRWETWFAHSDFLGGPGTDNRDRLRLSSDNPHGGTWAAFMPAAPGAGYRGASLDWRACDGEQKVNCAMRSFDSLYFRVWIRFADDHRYVHHFMNIGGSRPDDYWYHGTAGCLPNGELSMSTTVDFKEESHISHFYTYSPDMQCDTRCERYADVDRICADCAAKGLPTCTEQKQCCWGNHYGPEVPFPFPVGEWFCFEMMMIANTPSEHDGAMAYWVNDSLIHRVDTMMWRTSPTLALNRVRLQHYITTDDAEGHSNRVWFDDVVVSVNRIGMGESDIDHGPAAARGLIPPTAHIAPLRRAGYRVTVPWLGPVTLRVHDLRGKLLWRHHAVSEGSDVDCPSPLERPPSGYRCVTVAQDHGPGRAARAFGATGQER